MNRPAITVGMVVRNGERHIAHALESFLRQTRRDFLLVVHDNASTDRTVEIAQDHARRDSRVRVLRRPVDIGVIGNLVAAADAADTPLFCWAACDDLRQPEFLERLAALLDAHRDAGLACCAVRNIDPDGSPRDIRPETRCLHTSTGMSAAARLRMYLQTMPGTPFYGLFRTHALQRSLGVLRQAGAFAAGGPALLGVDMILLARFLRDHGLVCTPEPMLHFRRGGISHDFGRYGSLRGYLRQIHRFTRELRHATTLHKATMRDRASVRLARSSAVTRWLASRDMRRMTAHYLWHGTPVAATLRSRFSARADPAMRRLRARLRDLSSAPRIVLFGAGKHTRRRLMDLRRAVRGRGTIVAACDDHWPQCTPIDNLPIISPAQLPDHRADVLLVSSDAYEQAMFRRACAVVPAGTRVWCLYDTSLETSGSLAATASSDSTDAMNAAISASVSEEFAVR